jgi:hypothetical protein
VVIDKGCESQRRRVRQKTRSRTRLIEPAGGAAVAEADAPASAGANAALVCTGGSFPRQRKVRFQQAPGRRQQHKETYKMISSSILGEGGVPSREHCRKEILVVKPRILEGEST